jgi:hypothetical protein
MRLSGPSAWIAGAAMIAATVSTLSACTGDDEPADSTTTSTTSTGATITLTRPSAPLVVQIAQLRGGVKAKDRARIKHAIAKPIAAWVGAGFLDPSYPQSSFSDAFGSWTEGAAKLGRRDRDITTNAALGPNLVATVADKQAAKLYVFASDGRTGGATAQVVLRFTGERSDASLVHFVVRGDLYLTRKDSTWHIFGYRLSREMVA